MVAAGLKILDSTEATCYSRHFWSEPRIRVVASIVGAVDFWWDVTKTPPGLEQEKRKASYGRRVRE